MCSLTQIFEPKFISLVLLIKHITCDCGTPGRSPNIKEDRYELVSSIKSGVVIIVEEYLLNQYCK